MDKRDLLNEYDRIKSHMRPLRFNIGVLLACTAAMAWFKWYITSLCLLFSARFLFGILCSYKDFIRWADREKEKQQQVDDLRPKK